MFCFILCCFYFVEVHSKECLDIDADVTTVLQLKLKGKTKHSWQEIWVNKGIILRTTVGRTTSVQSKAKDPSPQQTLSMIFNAMCVRNSFLFTSSFCCQRWRSLKILKP
ncbi:hypothetical protein NL108_007359 [Boleophthalmus pectinirostris]|nr:hypothetical protein NL108_007359 [Boleophthalmus pectinirostris]